jgi:hypothetical protein
MFQFPEINFETIFYWLIILLQNHIPCAGNNKIPGCSSTYTHKAKEWGFSKQYLQSVTSSGKLWLN